MKRILLITDIFPPEIGGPATFIEALASKLTQMGDSVTVVCQATLSPGTSDASRPYIVRRIPRRRRRIGRMISQLQVMAVLARESLRHDIIFSNGLEHQTARVCQWLKRSFTLKIVGDPVWEGARNSRLTRALFDDFQAHLPSAPLIQSSAAQHRSLVRQAARILTPSEYLRKIVMGWGVHPDKITVILNGADLDEYDDCQPRRRSASELRALYVGRLVNWKGVDFLIEALRNAPFVHLTILGDGPELTTLRSLVDPWDLEGRVTFAGLHSAHEVRSALGQADVLVLPSDYEGLSHTLLEAAAAGLPLIASDHGGNPEVVSHEVNGLLVPYGNVQAIGAALKRLQQDEPFRFQLAVAAKLRSKDFSFTNTVVKTRDILIS